MEADAVKGVGAVSAVSPQAQALLAALEKTGASKAFDQMYVGQVSGQPRLFVALGRKGNAAVAYVCDGTKVGIWFTGSSAAAKKLTLQAADGSTLAGSPAATPSRFALTRDGYPVTATLRPATARDLLIRLRVKPPYEAVGGIIGIRGVLRGLTVLSPPTNTPIPPTSAPATSVTLSGPGLTLTIDPTATKGPVKEQCASLAAQYEANKAALEAEGHRALGFLGLEKTALTQREVERAALKQKKLSAGLTQAEAARLAQLDAEIANQQTVVDNFAAAVESNKTALASLAASYKVERRRLGCP